MDETPVKTEISADADGKKKTVESLSQKEINELIRKAKKNPKQALKSLEGLVDIRTLKQRAADEHPMRILDPGNLLKLALTIWGGSLAVLNLIASRGDVLGNEYFWAGTLTAGISGFELM